MTKLVKRWRNNPIRWVAVLACILLSLVAQAGEGGTTSRFSSQSEHVELRHIEGKGIGYSQGYMTLQAFFTPYTPHWVPLLDVRGHVFDNGKFAANAGIGLRYVSSRIYGLNVFYDYRQACLAHSQVTWGLEMLGESFDIRLNAYFPYGRKGDRVLKGGNAELGIPLFSNKDCFLYGALGPYYLTGERRSGFGARARLAITLHRHVRLEVSGSYDPLFRGIGQGELSLIYFFGPKIELKHLDAVSCDRKKRLREKAVQNIDRFEIIMLNH